MSSNANLRKTFERRLRAEAKNVNALIESLMKRHRDDPRENLWEGAFEFDIADKPALKTFKEFGLDPNSPFECRALLEIFCRSYFFLEGRPVEWTEVRWTRFMMDVEKIKRKLGGKRIPTVKICRELQLYRPSRYGKMTIRHLSRLVKRLPDQLRMIVNHMGDRAYKRLKRNRRL